MKEKTTSEVILAKLNSVDANDDVWTKEGLESLIEVAKGAGFDAHYDSQRKAVICYLTEEDEKAMREFILVHYQSS